MQAQGLSQIHFRWLVASLERRPDTNQDSPKLAG